MVGQRVLVMFVGALLIVLGFLDVHVQVASIVVGLVLVGGVSGEWLVALLRAPRREDSNDHH